MPIETEVKIALSKRQADEIYKKIGSPSWIKQTNYLLSLKGNLLRFRQEQNRTFFTIKGKNTGKILNQRQEIECSIPLEFFNELKQFSPGLLLEYEKNRASQQFMNCHICIDEFFKDYFLEVEGKEENILEVLAFLELREKPIERRSYAELLERRNYGLHRKNL